MPTPFLIWTTQRTGSTVFWRTLDAHPRVEAHGEMFLPEMERPDSYTSFLRESALHRLERRLAPRRSVARYLARLGRAGPGVEAVGLKLMYNHLTPPLRAWIDAERPGLIHLVRRDALRLLVSRVAAEQRGLYHLAPGAEPPTDRVKLDPGSLLARLERIEREVEGGRAFAAGRDTLEVAYEDLVSAREATYARVFAFLGVPPLAGPLPEPLRRIHAGPLPELLENWDEVRARLAGTRWEALLAER